MNNRNEKMIEEIKEIYETVKKHEGKIILNPPSNQKSKYIPKSK